MNEYEKAFVQKLAQLKVAPGPDFAALTKAALEGEWGGEGDELLRGLGEQVLEDPEKFAAELSRTYGHGAVQYFTLIVKYAESGKSRPEDKEEQREKDEVETIVEEVEDESDEDSVGDALPTQK